MTSTGWQKNLASANMSFIAGDVAAGKVENDPALAPSETSQGSTSTIGKAVEKYPQVQGPLKDQMMIVNTGDVMMTNYAIANTESLSLLEERRRLLELVENIPNPPGQPQNDNVNVPSDGQSTELTKNSMSGTSDADEDLQLEDPLKIRMMANSASANTMFINLLQGHRRPPEFGDAKPNRSDSMDFESEPPPGLPQSDHINVPIGDQNTDLTGDFMSGTADAPTPNKKPPVNHVSSRRLSVEDAAFPLVEEESLPEANDLYDFESSPDNTFYTFPGFDYGHAGQQLGIINIGFLHGLEASSTSSPSFHFNEFVTQPSEDQSNDRFSISNTFSGEHGNALNQRDSFQAFPDEPKRVPEFDSMSFAQPNTYTEVTERAARSYEDQDDRGISGIKRPVHTGNSYVGELAQSSSHPSKVSRYAAIAQQQQQQQNMLFLHSLRPSTSQVPMANMEFSARDQKRLRRHPPSTSPDSVVEDPVLEQEAFTPPLEPTTGPSRGDMIEGFADSSNMTSYFPSHFANREFLGRDLASLYSLQPTSRTLNDHSTNEDQKRTNSVSQDDDLSSSRLIEIDLDAYPTFRYSPLSKERPGSVRLVKLQNLSTANDIYCEIVCADMYQDDMEYICLSYCWGDGGRDRIIYIKEANGPNARHRSLAITENLYCALRSLQASETYSTRLMWIDMISINQNDLRERADQVALMKSIYDKAEDVVVWLGGSQSAQTARPIISWIYESLLAKTGLKAASIAGSEGLKLNQEHLYLLKEFTTVDIPGSSPIQAYELLAQFFSLPWFRRVWVLQEASSHRTVTARIGEYTLPFEAIIIAALWQSFLTRSYTSLSDVELGHARSGQGYLPELWLNLLHTRKPRGLPIIELVCRARDFQASDPRDKLFAMLGLANDVYTSSGLLPYYLQPDYTISKDAVYMRFAKGIIAQTGNLDILSAVNTFSGQPNEASATWMPQLDVPIATIRGLGFPRKYNAAFATKQVLNATTNDCDANLLSLSGFVVDTVGYKVSSLLTLSPQLHLQVDSDVEAVTDLWSRYVIGMAYCNSAQKRAKLQAYVNTITAAGFAVPRSFPEYPLGQVEPPQNVPSIIADFAAYWAREDRKFSILDVDRAKFVEYAKTGDADQFAVLAGKACHERKFFYIGNSRMGLCPRNAKEGDKIVVLYGGSVPYVLRQKAGDTWAFVGECYVDGLMFGEVQKLKEDLNIAEQVFHIR
ncbi:hypothetical protein BU23DRAFT_531979 [Bimuria novae-zelandiae CBS 107.79]|uniref:Heterokaryon incompatibility domain-containing protein n=1 Tax=Bimuria novae-zelandiae CBS 107.79 TaxID=1447943 RepID=A0A6A5VLW7_9PLEO|nr:hypothetical protein BU23DRAFT_531979 [Bimuria novae-zelandiae CBS 107.79]